MLFQDLKEYISKAGEVTFADAHKRRQGEGLVSEYIHTYVQKKFRLSLCEMLSNQTLKLVSIKIDPS